VDTYRAHGLCGLLVSQLTDFHQQHVGHRVRKDNRGIDMPNRNELCSWLKERSAWLKLQPGELGQFMNGQPTKRRDDHDNFWFEITWDLFDLILLGTDPQQPPTVDSRALFESIRSFFLGNEKGKFPAFFQANRWHSPGPFTRDEALEGTRWLVQRQKLMPGAGLGAFVSGVAPFEPLITHVSGANESAQITLQLAQSGFHIHFIYPDARVVGDSDAAESATRFADWARAQDEHATIYLHPISPILLDKSRGLWSGAFLSPWHRYTYVELQNVKSDPASASDLYITRTVLDTSPKDWLPYADLADTKEQASFRSWLQCFVLNT